MQNVNLICLFFQFWGVMSTFLNPSEIAVALDLVDKKHFLNLHRAKGDQFISLQPISKKIHRNNWPILQHCSPICLLFKVLLVPIDISNCIIHLVKNLLSCFLLFREKQGQGRSLKVLPVVDIDGHRNLVDKLESSISSFVFYIHVLMCFHCVTIQKSKIQCYSDHEKRIRKIGVYILRPLIYKMITMQEKLH